MTAAAPSAQGATERVRRFFIDGGFACFSLALLFFYELVLLALLVMPGGASDLGAFADDFRVWCFGWDPATGRMNWAYPLALTTPPALIAALLLVLWREPLRATLARPRRLAASVAAAAALASAAAAGFALLATPPATGELPFPAESLRTAHPAPELRLVDQTGAAVDLAELRGSVVLLTAVYASCPHTCPLILQQTKRALGELRADELGHLQVVAVTLDPAHDSREVLGELASRHGLEAPLYHLVTGDVPEVERVLDRMDLSRRRDPESGVIDHANLFLLLDAQGKVAYRLTLGERQERWLVSALQILLREASDAS